MKRWVMMFLLAIASLHSYAQSGFEHKDNLFRYGEAGYALDKAHYDNGSLLDLVIFDLEEAQRQGREIPESLLKDARDLDKLLRASFLELEHARVGFSEQIHLPRPKSTYFIAVEDLVDAPATTRDWAGFTEFTLRWGDGTELEIPLNSFRHGIFLRDYDNGAGPEAGIFIYGRRSTSYIAVSDFALPEPLPAGNATLTVRGMDSDKGGVTPIMISIFGNAVFSGANPFPKVGTSELMVEVPQAYFSHEPATNANPVLAAELDAFAAQITEFELNYREQVAAIVERAAPFRENLVYERSAERGRFAERGFLRAIDIVDHLYRPELFRYPGYYYNYEHIAKAMGELDADLASLWISRPGGNSEVMEVLKVFDRYTPIPYILWGNCEDFEKNNCATIGYFGDYDRLMRDMTTFLERGKSLENMVGVMVNEPVIRDGRDGLLVDNAALMKLYREYAAERQEAVTAAGFAPLPDAPSDAAPTTAQEWVNYMEYQYFKMQTMAAHYGRLYRELRGRGLYCYLVDMDMLAGEAQAGSYYAMGAAMPELGTDLYDDGSVREGVSMQLLKSAMGNGRAIMWPGAGYSCKTPLTYARSLLNGMVWADGLHIWTLMYAGKYRDPNSFWRQGGKELSFDDRGGGLTYNWHPDYWGILCDVFARTGELDAELAGRWSINPIGILLSERTIVSLVKPRRANSQHYQNFLGLYSELAGKGVPLDALFVESLGDLARAPHEVLILPDAICMSDSEAATLRDFVADGGTLIVTGRSGAHDQWNLPRKVGALAELTGGERMVHGQVEFFRRDFGSGVVYTIPAEEIGKVVEAIPGCGLSGSIAAEYSELIHALLQPTLERQVIQVESPYGTVIQLSENPRGEVLVGAINYLESAEPVEIKVKRGGITHIFSFSIGDVFVLPEEESVVFKIVF